MLFISSAPVQVEIQEDRRVIILMHNKIMFSHLDFIEEYLAIPLITPNPKKMYYEPSVMQVMVVSESTLEVYYCDWKTQIKLIRVIILNNQTVDTISYDKQSGWHVFGSMMQYEPTRINFHKGNDLKNVRFLSKCYINKNMYLLTDTKLQRSHEGQPFMEIAWKDRMMVLRNCNFKVEMSGASTIDKKRDILCINQTYALILSKHQVLTTIIQPTIAYYQNNLLISYTEQGKLTTVQKYENNQFVEIGTIHRADGEICCAFLYQDDLMMLMYEERQIRLNSLPLVDHVQGPASTPTKKGNRRRKLYQSISRIMEESHEEGSQFIPHIQNVHDQYKQLNTREKVEPDFSPANRPIVRDISAIEDQIKDTSLNQGNSEVLSRSGLGQPTPRQAQDFTDQNLSGSAEGQVSFQINDQKSKRKIQSKYSAQFKSNSYKHTKNKRAGDHFRSDNLRAKRRGSQDEKMMENQLDGTNSQISNNSSTSKKYDSKKVIRNEKGNKNADAHNTSGLSNHSQNDHAETPAFGFESAGGDKWASFDRQWNEGAKDQINQEMEQDIEQSVCIEDAEKSLLKFVPEQLPLKVQKFKPINGMLTAQMYSKIQKSSYCSLISKAIEQDPDRFQQFMELFLPNVLDQPEAPLFFQKNIRTFNPQFTQDKIRKLFGSFLNDPDIKPKMTSAVQLFKLSEVPRQILCFPQDFLKVISILYKDLYIQDLLKPSQTTIDYLLESYFSIRNFNEEIITIEDEEIDISHPRNMLNVLLYLNQYMKLKIEIIIKVYCSKLLSEDHLDILRKITLKENIFEICEVPRSVLDDVVIERFNQLLNESVENAEYLWSVIQFLSPGVSDQYRIKLAVISQLNKCNITFDFNMLNKIKNTNTDIYTFLQKIINENSCRNLVSLKIQNIYRSLYWLQEGDKIMYVTNQYVELAKSLAQKFCQKKLFYYAINLLDPILSKVKTSFIAKLFMTYLNSKFLNRLYESSNIIAQRLSFLFPQIANNPDIDPSTFPNDKVKLPQFSQSFSCSWTKFLGIFDKHLQGPIQLKMLTFCQINIVNQIYLMLDQNMKRKFQKFLSEIEGNMIVQLDDINENDDSINPKGITSIRFEFTPKNELQSQMATSTVNREDVLLHDDNESRKKIVYKSMTLIDHYNQINSEKIARRNSDEKNRNDRGSNENDELMRIKLLVGRNQIIEQLCQIYESKTQDLFLQSLHLVDLEKVQLYHLDTFKSIVNKQVEYPLSRVLPFQIFLTPQLDQAFQTARPKIKTQITIRNFWVIYAIIQLMFKMGNQICKMFIQKCVLYFRSDDFYEVISSMMEVTKPKIDMGFVTKMAQSAKDYKLIRIEKLLKEYKTINSFA